MSGNLGETSTAKSARSRFLVANKLVAVIAGVIVTSLVSFGLYTLIGISANTSAVAIYDEFPQEFWSVDSETRLTCSVKNKASHTIPGFNPLYNLRVTFVEAENEEFCYFIGKGGDQCNFTRYVLDMGRIDSGDSEDATLVFHLCQGNVTFSIDVSLTVYSYEVFASSRTYSIEYQGKDRYTIAGT